jgi:hypothetical protein
MRRRGGPDGACNDWPGPPAGPFDAPRDEFRNLGSIKFYMANDLHDTKLVGLPVVEIFVENYVDIIPFWTYAQDAEVAN